MAKVSGAILNDAKVNVAKLIANVATSHSYAGMGAGENTDEADAADTDLKGTDTHYNDADGGYEANYKSVWQSIFLYADFAVEGDHTIRELLVCESAANHANKSLLRVTIDEIKLNLDEQVSIIIKNAVQQGS